MFFSLVGKSLPVLTLRQRSPQHPTFITHHCMERSGLLMKTKLMILLVLILTGGLMVYFFNSINVNFATEVTLTLRYHGENDIVVQVTDKALIRELKSIFRGFIWTDSGHSCGFSEEFSITFSNNERSITLYPALDECPIIGVNTTGRHLYISRANRERFHEIIHEYGYRYY